MILAQSKIIQNLILLNLSLTPGYDLEYDLQYDLQYTRNKNILLAFIVLNCRTSLLADIECLKRDELIFMQLWLSLIKFYYMFCQQQNKCRFMRSDGYKQKTGERRYSLEDMRAWCQRMVDAKAEVLLSEINENNSIIKILSQKLTKTEQELLKKQQILNTVCQKMFSKCQSSNIQIINKLLNDKLKDKFQHINRMLLDIQNNKNNSIKSAINVAQYQKAMEQIMSNQIKSLKYEIKQKMEDVKQNSDKYWKKIKEWAKMFEDKQKKCQEGILILHKEIKRLEDSVSSARIGIFKIKNFKQRLKEIEQTVYDLEQSFKLIGQRQTELKQFLQTDHYHPEIVQLSYSKDQSQIYYIPESNRSKKRDNQYFQTTADQYSHPKQLGKSGLKGNLSQVGSVGYSSVFGGFQKKCIGFQDLSMLSSVKSEEGRISFSSRLKSLQNISTNIIQSRKLMVKETKCRLKQLIEVKGLEVPLVCYLDELKYLKNQQNNYMFDCEGNMFKLTEEDFRQLCLDNILMSR